MSSEKVGLGSLCAPYAGLVRGRASILGLPRLARACYIRQKEQERGGSSVGRASRSQCEGRGFNSPPLHCTKARAETNFSCLPACDSAAIRERESGNYRFSNRRAASAGSLGANRVARRHKATRQAVLTLDGRDSYFFPGSRARRKPPRYRMRFQARPSGAAVSRTSGSDRIAPSAIRWMGTRLMLWPTLAETGSPWAGSSP